MDKYLALSSLGPCPFGAVEQHLGWPMSTDVTALSQPESAQLLSSRASCKMWLIQYQERAEKNKVRDRFLLGEKGWGAAERGWEFNLEKSQETLASCRNWAISLSWLTLRTLVSTVFIRDWDQNFIKWPCLNCPGQHFWGQCASLSEIMRSR